MLAFMKSHGLCCVGFDHQFSTFSTKRRLQAFSHKLYSQWAYGHAIFAWWIVYWANIALVGSCKIVQMRLHCATRPSNVHIALIHRHPETHFVARFRLVWASIMHIQLILCIVGDMNRSEKGLIWKLHYS